MLPQYTKRTPTVLESILQSHRTRYYQLLNELRFTGDWESWFGFFADAVIETATQAVETAQQLTQLGEDDSIKIRGLKRISGSAQLIHKAMLERPIASPGWVKDKTQLSQATVNTCLVALEKVGIVQEVTGQKRNRLYAYPDYIDIMNQGTELP